MQNKIKNHSTLLCIVKTNENKIFGGYTSLKIEYKDKNKKEMEINNLKIEKNKFVYFYILIFYPPQEWSNKANPQPPK